MRLVWRKQAGGEEDVTQRFHCLMNWLWNGRFSLCGNQVIMAFLLRVDCAFLYFRTRPHRRRSGPAFASIGLDLGISLSLFLLNNFSPFCLQLAAGRRGAGAKRVERIRKDIFAWTCKKASVTNPLKYEAHNLLYAADFAYWVTQQNPAALKYLDESHFENWGSLFFTFFGNGFLVPCRLFEVAMVPRRKRGTRNQGKTHA